MSSHGACARSKVPSNLFRHPCRRRSTKIAESQNIVVWRSTLCHQTVESHDNLFLFASNRLEWPMSTTNRAFSPATPIYHTYQCHVLFPLRMLDLKIGKGRRVVKSIISKSMHTRHYCYLPPRALVNRGEPWYPTEQYYGVTRFGILFTVFALSIRRRQSTHRVGPCVLFCNNSCS